MIIRVVYIRVIRVLFFGNAVLFIGTLMTQILRNADLRGFFSLCLIRDYPRCLHPRYPRSILMERCSVYWNADDADTSYRGLKLIFFIMFYP